MSDVTAFTSAIAAVQNVLVVARVPGKKPKQSRSSRARPKSSPPPKAAPNARGKSFQPADLKKPVVIQSASTRMRQFAAKLDDAGIDSPKKFFQMIDEARVRMVADGTTQITVSSWLGTILEIQGPLHPHVKITTGQFLSEAVEFANDAVTHKRDVFVDGIGRVRSLPKPLQMKNVREIYDLKINGQKYCDRAFIHTDEAGDMFLILTQEFKTAGNKLSDVDVQQLERNVRIVDETRAVTIGKTVGSDGTKLSYFEPGKKAKQEIDIDKVLVHTENTNSQIGIKASRQAFEEVRFPHRKGRDKYGAVFFYMRIEWPSREIRAVLQTVWNQL